MSLYGKIAIIKSLALSKLNYCIMCLPTPQWFINKVQNTINNFLWNNKPPRLKHTTAISDYEKGGVKMVNFESFVKAQKVSWVKRLVVDNSALHYVRRQIPYITISEFLCCHIHSKEIPINISLFYKQVLQAWFTLRFKSMESDDIVLWYNHKIRIQNNYVFYKKWYKKGIFLLKDLFNENGEIMTFNELKTKYDITDNIMNYMSIIHAIPNEWINFNFINNDT